MHIIKTTCVSGTLCQHNGQEIALIVPVGLGLYNVMPNSRLVQSIGAVPRCCLGLQAAELFVKVLASEWEVKNGRS
jgi:hypothetical protein